MPQATMETETGMNGEAAAVAKKGNPATGSGLRGFSREDLHGLLADMLLYRRFEEKAEEAYAIGKIGGFCHLHIGQEGLAAGSIKAMRPDDPIITAYRDHTHGHREGDVAAVRRWRSSTAAPPAAPGVVADRCTSSTPRWASTAATASSADRFPSARGWAGRSGTGAATRFASATWVTRPSTRARFWNH